MFSLVHNQPSEQKALIRQYQVIFWFG